MGYKSVPVGNKFAQICSREEQICKKKGLRGRVSQKKRFVKSEFYKEEMTVANIRRKDAE